MASVPAIRERRWGSFGGRSHIALLFRRSTDHGGTWGDQQVAAVVALADADAELLWVKAPSERGPGFFGRIPWGNPGFGG